MDEASGNYFGKRLIRDYYCKNAEQLMKEFEKVRLRPSMSSRWTSTNVPTLIPISFAEFIFTAEEVNSYFGIWSGEAWSVLSSIGVLCYKEAQNVPFILWVDRPFFRRNDSKCHETLSFAIRKNHSVLLMGSSITTASTALK